VPGHSSVGDQEKARAILDVPGGYEVAYLLGVGYPADRPLKPIRKPKSTPIRRGRPSRALVSHGFDAVGDNMVISRLQDDELTCDHGAISAASPKIDEVFEHIREYL
jgi:hypothetical protein